MDSFLSIIIDADYVHEQFVTHPHDMWAFSALVFFLTVAIFFPAGIGLGKYLCKRERRELDEMLGKAKDRNDRLEKEIQLHRLDLDRLARAEKKNEELSNLIATERTLSSSYLSKYKEASAKLEERERVAAKEERKRKLSEDRYKAAYKEWVLSLYPEEKLLLLGIYRDGEKTLGPMSEQEFDDWTNMRSFRFMEGIDYTRVSGRNDRYRWRLTLNEPGMAAVSENMDVFLEAERYAEQGTNDANAGAGVR